MEIELNGSRGAMEAPPDASLEQILLQVRGALAQYGKVASEIALDGEPLTASREEELGGRRAGDFTLLQVTAVLVTDLVKHIIKGLLEAIDVFKQKIRGIGELSQMGKRSEALTALGVLAGDLAAFADGIQNCLAFVRSRSSLDTPEIEEQLESFRSLLVRLNEVVTSAPDVEFSNLLQYDIPPAVEAWRPILEETQKTLIEVEQGAGGDTGGD